MAERLYPLLRNTAIVLTLLWIGWTLYDHFRDKSPADFAYSAAENLFADGDYQGALREYEAALVFDPEYIPARRGRAETLIMLQREPEAIAVYDELIALQTDNPGHYANRGIAHDRIGHHAQALQDYLSALQLDPEVGSGPGWLTRFLRNQVEKPPGIAERAQYLKEQLALPPEKRLLRLPQADAVQRPYQE